MSVLARRSRSERERCVYVGAFCAVALTIICPLGLSSVLPPARTISSDFLDQAGEAWIIENRQEVSVNPQTPFLVALIVYGMQTLLTGLCLLAVVRRTFYVGSLAPPLARAEKSLRIYLVVSITAMMTYTYLTFSSGSFLIVMSPAGGPHYLCRNLLWLVSTPGQWYAYCVACTAANRRQISSVITATIMMQLCGILMLTTGNFALILTFFLLGTTSFLAMFRCVFILPCVEDYSYLAKRLLVLEMILWSLYPVTVLLRLFGLINWWTEQVLVFTLLDVSTKSVTLTLILVCHFFTVVQEADRAFKLINP